MAESGLSLNRTQLREAVGTFLDLGFEVADYSTDHLLLIDRAIDDGLRSFYEPEPLPGERTPHIWSFTKPIGELMTVGGQSDYDLPDDFGGMEDRFYLVGDDMSSVPLLMTNMARMLARREVDDSSSGPPQMTALNSIPSTGETPTRWSVSIWPVPSGEYTLKFPYRSNPYALSATAPYPLGGQPHAETLKESCLAAAERNVNDELGIHNDTFRRRLAASVALDRRLFGTKNYGYNGDRKRYRPLRHPDTNHVVTINGITPGI
jgi:hypothetical protein